MKTVKYLYGFSHGTNAEHSYMYCWQKRAKKRMLIAAKSREPWKYKQAWNGRLFSQSVAAKPVRGTGGGPDGKGKWSPIFDIPIINVHFCTLHALYRIVEKIVHLQISYVWIMKDDEEKKAAVAAMEQCLSMAGLGGKAVVLRKDPKLSGTNIDLPCKLSFNGAKYHKMFQKAKWSTKNAAWKNVCEAKSNTIGQGQGKADRQECWKAFADLQEYFTAMSLTPEQIRAYKEKLSTGEGRTSRHLEKGRLRTTWYVRLSY
jgi:hypothetical protein